MMCWIFSVGVVTCSMDSYMKDSLAGTHPHALIFHRSGVFRARRVHRQRVEAYLRKILIIHRSRAVFGYRAQQSHMFVRIAAIGSHSRLLRVKRLELRARITLGLELTLLP